MFYISITFDAVRCEVWVIRSLKGKMVEQSRSVNFLSPGIVGSRPVQKNSMMSARLSNLKLIITGHETVIYNTYFFYIVSELSTEWTIYHKHHTFVCFLIKLRVNGVHILLWSS